MKNPRVCLGAINNKGVLFRPILATEIWKETDSIAKLGQQFEYTIGSETKKIFPHSTEDVLVTGYKMLPNKVQVLILNSYFVFVEHLCRNKAIGGCSTQ